MIGNQFLEVPFRRKDIKMKRLPKYTPAEVRNDPVSYTHLRAHETESDLELDERTMAKGLFEHAGVAAHPSDYGMQCISDRIMGKINEIM